MPNHRKHVILLRHCVRSTSSHIEVCDGENNTKRTARLSEFITAPLPKWDVPSQWCTGGGMDIIGYLGNYLINNVINITSTSNMHVVVNIVSDDSQRDVDTSLALMRGMKKTLDANSTSSYSGLDQIHVNQQVFGHTSSGSGKTTCPSTHAIYHELSDQISDRIVRLPPSDFHVQDVLDRIISLGVGLNESILVDNNSSLYDRRCPGSMSLSMNLLEYIAEMALYSRASHVHPPFLPSASDEDVYRMKYMKDYIRSTEGLDNKYAAKRGLILAKSMLNALLRVESDDASRRTYQGDNRDSITITVFVGHESNVRQIATAIGLRWTMPSPYVYGSDNHIGKIVSIPPGSGIIFSSFPKSDGDLSMSFVVPVNLTGTNTNTKNHELVPIYTINMTEPELAIRDDVAANATVSLKELKNRLEATMMHYPDLRACYDDAPIYLGLNDLHQITALSTTMILLVAMVAVNLIGCVVFVVIQYRSPKQKYEQLSQDNRSEVELC